MVLYLLLPVTAWLAYRTGVLMYLRSVVFGRRKPAVPERLARLRFWAEHPLSPAKLEARLYWADVMRSQDVAAALELLRPVMEREGRKAVPALLMAAHWALKDGWLEHAERHCQEALRRLPRKKDKLVRARIQRLRAEVALRVNEARRAVAALGQSIDDNPYDAETRLLRAWLAFQCGDADTAGGDYDFIAKHFGNRALRVQTAVGGSYVDVWRGDFAAALGRLDALLADKQESEKQVALRRVCVRALLGDAARARAELAGLGDEDAQFTYPRACIAAAEGDWDLARRKLAELLFQGALTEARSAEAMWLLAGVLREASQEGQATEIEARLRTIWPESPYLKKGWRPVRIH